MSKQKNRGKEAKDDIHFNTQNKALLKNAVEDMHYLLTRGYSEKNALHTVGTRYKLTQRQLKALQGMAASEDHITICQQKSISVNDLKGKELTVDGFNIIILLESLLSQAFLFKGLDGCYRDLSEVHGTYKMVNQTPLAISCIADFCTKYEISKMLWIFDKPVSNSGRIKQQIETFAEEKGLDWKVMLENNADETIIRKGNIVVSSDAYVIANAINWFNLITFLVETEKIPATTFDITHDA